MEYIFHILIFIGLYIILSISLNLLIGYTGILSIAHAAFYGIGAYTAALLSLNYQASFFIVLFVSILVSAIIGLIVGLPSIRIKDDYFAIASFGFQVIIFHILNNWVSFTGGPMGLPGIPNLSIFGVVINSNFKFLMLTYFFVISIFLITNRISKSPVGRILKALREDEILVQSQGKNVASFKIKIFIISSCIASISGILFAHYITFIDPSSFTVMESIYIISIVIIGGTGNLKGSILGAIILVLMSELLRFVGLPSSVAANSKQIIYGLLLISFILWRPQGLKGEYNISK
ncbi:branched-chain amino acid ABC transporter permease [candidate division KSB1 bacterium]